MRVAHWEVILHECIEAARARPFSYGEHDCATWAFRVRAALTGVDVTGDWVGRYRTELGAARRLRALGCADVAELATKYLGDPLPTVRLAQRGDIVLYDGALGVCVGDRVALVADDGLTFVRLRACDQAWRVA